MSNAETAKDEPPGTHEADPKALAAAKALIELSRTHLQSQDSPSCTCGGLRRMTQIILDADYDPETEVEDWQAMGIEFLRMRASGANPQVALQVKTTTKRGKKVDLTDKALKISGLDTESESPRQYYGLEVSGTVKQEDKAMMKHGTGLRGSKKTRNAKLKSRRTSQD